jgi:uncharacterized membrane protein
MNEAHTAAGLSVHRSEALTDGIYAVAMTLLVIELKLPDHSLVHGAEGLAQALAHLLPKILAWVISFFVLAFFWFGHHRAFAHVRHADGKLVALNLGQLALVSLMPFSSALAGEHGRELMSQIIYSTNMAALAIMALLTSRYIRRHPQAALMSMPDAAYRGARIRLVGVMLVSVLAVGIASVVPTAGNVAFLLMAVIMPLSRRAERASGLAAPDPAPR